MSLTIPALGGPHIELVCGSAERWVEIQVYVYTLVHM